jgi:HK97 family phage major capsid protein
MNNNLFNAIRLHLEGKGLNNELKSIQARANEQNKRANINAIGQVQIPLAELRGVVSNSASTKNFAYEVTPQSTLFDKCKYLQGLQSNAKYPIFKSNCTKWENETIPSAATANITLNPHRLYAELSYTTTLINSADVTLQEALTQDIVNCIYDKVEKTILSDADATNGNPKGILNQLSAHTITSSATLSEIAAIEKAFYESGSKTPTYVFSSSAYGKMKATHANLFNNGTFNDIPYIVTNNMKDSCYLLCDLSKLVVAEFGSLDVEIDKVTQLIEGKIRLFVNTWFDWGMINKDSFIFASMTW